MVEHREGHRCAEAGQGDHPVVQPYAGHPAEHHRQAPAEAHGCGDPLRPALRGRQGAEQFGRAAHTHGPAARALLHRACEQDGGGAEGVDAGPGVRPHLGREEEWRVSSGEWRVWAHAVSARLATHHSPLDTQTLPPHLLPLQARSGVRQGGVEGTAWLAEACLPVLRFHP